VFAAARERLPELKVLFIGSGRLGPILAEAGRIGVQLGPDEIRSVTAAREDVSRWINAGDVGLCFCTPTFSSLGVSATKVGEYLACGLPVVGNRQIGDFARIVEAVGSGNVLDDLTEESLREAGERMPGLIHAERAQIRERARRFLDLHKGVDAYRQIYEDLLQPVSVEP
jgi:glycosyltransferase involved in cell wall biosynthesis